VRRIDFGRSSRWHSVTASGRYWPLGDDVARLLDLGMVEKTADALVRVPWNAVRAKLRFD